MTNSLTAEDERAAIVAANSFSECALCALPDKPTVLIDGLCAACRSQKMGTGCSFCDKQATHHVSDEGDMFDCCRACADAWQLDPSFTSERAHLQKDRNHEG